MNSPTVRICIGLILSAVALFADVPLPGNMLEPQTPAEAWNVIRLTTANVDRLITEDRPEEIPTQISLCSPALRALAKASGTPEVRAIADRAAGWVVATASAGIEKNAVRAANTMKPLRTLLDQLAGHFDARTVKAEIFVCPTHPEVVSEDAAIPCVKCGRALMPRRIPYSFVYVKPGAPTIELRATADAPIEAGRETKVKVQLRKAGGAPLVTSDLLVMHTAPIHLLLEEPGLGDYHHELPTRTETPGEFEFTFTPRKTAPYRLWADLVPIDTGLQELPFVDLPSKGKGGAIDDLDDRFTATAGGLNFTLTVGGNIQPRARRGCGLSVTITDAEGQPMTQLEPVMGAFGRLVAFYDDFETVLHLHPATGEVLQSEMRGGPSLLFTLFPPRAGFLRLYCQVQVNGESILAPFSLNVQP